MDPEHHRRVRQKAEDDKAKAKREGYEAEQDARVEKLVAAVENIVKHADSYADEKSPENRSKRRREWLEIFGLWAAAGIGAIAIIVGNVDARHQLREAKHTRTDNEDFVVKQLKALTDQTKVLSDQTAAAQKSADAAKTSADANAGQLNEMRQSGRAWVGPTDAAFKEQPKQDTGAIVLLSIINSGKEPAINFREILYDPFPADSPNATEVIEKIQQNRDACFAVQIQGGGSAIYPNVSVTGFVGSPTGQSASFTIPAGWMTEGLFKKSSIIVFTGCLAYNSVGATHHSSFCYFWNGDVTTFNHLNICMGAGNDAD